MRFKLFLATLLSVSLTSFSQPILTDDTVIIGDVEWLKWDISPSLTIEEFQLSDYKRDGWQIADQFQILELLDVFKFDHSFTADLSSIQYMNLDTPLYSTDDPASQLISAFGDIATRIGSEPYEGDYYQSTSTIFLNKGDLNKAYGYLSVNDEWEEPPQYGKTPFEGAIYLNSFAFNPDQRIGLALFRPVTVSEPSAFLFILGFLAVSFLRRSIYK